MLLVIRPLNLAGVVFSPKLDGDDKPPCEQSALSPDQLWEKEYALFGKAISELALHWKGMEFNGCPVKLEAVICGNDELKWADHEEVKCFFKSPIRELHQFLQHNDCNLNEILFVKCKDWTYRKKWNCEKNELYKHFQIFNFWLLAAAFSAIHDGHYQTFLQQYLNKDGRFGDDGQPTTTKANLEKCTQCPNFSFKLKTGRDQHKGMFHHRQNCLSWSRHWLCWMLQAFYQYVSIKSV